MKNQTSTGLRLLRTSIAALITKFSLFFLSDRGFGLLCVLENSVSRAKMVYYQTNLRRCGARLSLQFPLTITHPESVELGDNVSLAAFVHIRGKGGVQIGNKVMVGAHTSISSLTHDYIAEDMYNSLVAKPVVIEDNVWVGSNCVIMPGIRIGTGAVVGAGSVVTKNVDTNSIVYGVPAQHVKYRN